MDDVNPLKDNINNITKNTEALFDVSKEAGLEVDTEKRMLHTLKKISRVSHQ
jgi:hypothetical protein